MPVPEQKPSLNKSEIERFAAMAAQWWQVDGPLAQLHRMNPVRIKFILDHIPNNTLYQQRVLDIGCGGGIASISFARKGAMVTAIDACEENIHIAKAHASKLGISTINYQHTTIEQLVKEKTLYDVITCLEVVEHVDNLPEFLHNTTNMLAPGGVLFISTINKTLKSYLAAIVIAEHVLNWVPANTHDWNKFIKPSHLCSLMPNMRLTALSGMEMNIITNQWLLSNKVDVNYICAFSSIDHNLES